MYGMYTVLLSSLLYKYRVFVLLTVGLHLHFDKQYKYKWKPSIPVNTIYKKDNTTIKATSTAILKYIPRLSLKWQTCFIIYSPETIHNVVVEWLIAKPQIKTTVVVSEVHNRTAKYYDWSRVNENIQPHYGRIRLKITSRYFSIWPRYMVIFYRKLYIDLTYWFRIVVPWSLMNTHMSLLLSCLRDPHLHLDIL